jgi:hypothetical protein
MKNYILLSLTLFLLIAFSSCSLDKESEMYYRQMGVVKGNSASTFMVEGDGGLVFKVVQFPPGYEIVDGKRVIIRYSVVNSFEDQPYDYTIRIESVQNILTKNIVHVTSDEIRDTLQTDPVAISLVWVTKSFINVEFLFKGNNRVHYFDLALDPEKQTKEGFISLDFHHNAKGDSKVYEYRGIISFPIEELQVEGVNSVKLNFRTTGEYNTPYVKELEYNYAEE